MAAFAFRPTRVVRDPAGRKVKQKARKWYARWRDAASGRWRTRAGYMDRPATEALARRLERESALRHEGLLPPENRHRQTPLADHVAAYRQHLIDQDDTDRHADEQASKLIRLFDGCGFRVAGELDPGIIAGWLAERRRERKRFGLVTSNHYVTAVRAFSAWLKASGRAAVDTLDRLAKLDDRADRRHPRRVLPADEFARLLAAARSRVEPKYGLPGDSRAALYLTAAYTGLRAGELASLTAGWLDLDGEAPTLTLRATADKRRRGAVLPLHPDVVAELRRLSANLAPTDRLWPGTWAAYCSAAVMLRADLAAAGIPYQDQRGRFFDFHALRAQFITSLGRAGVPLAVAQKLARHSTPTLTANIYTLLEDSDLAAGVNSLPPAEPVARTRPRTRLGE